MAGWSSNAKWSLPYASRIRACAVERYVYVEADAAALYPIARGLRGWSDAIADGSVRVFGEPELVRGLPGWFRAIEPVEAPQPAPRLATA